MPLHSANAMKVAQYLDAHELVERVYYGGLPSHPGHDIMASQVCDGKHFGGMVSFQVCGGWDNAVRVAANTKLFRRATSLGGTESLIEHRKSVEPEDSPTPDNLLRLSVGLEDANDLIADLGEALCSAC